MKNQKIIITLGVVAALTFIVGCDSKPANEVDNAAKKTEGVATEVGKAVEGVKPAVEKAVTDAKNTATDAAAEASAKANSIIDQAKALVSQSKYTEALSALGNLSSLKLTDEQTKIVTSLKEQIQKAMAAKATTDATGAAGNLLK
jgi:hypothetical protein